MKPLPNNVFIHFNSCFRNLTALIIYDLLGRVTATLVNEFHKHSIQNSSLPSGIYYYHIVTEKYSKTK